MESTQIIEVLKVISKEVKKDTEEIFKETNNKIKQIKINKPIQKRDFINKEFNLFVNNLKEISKKHKLYFGELFIFTILDRKMCYLFGYRLVSLARTIPLCKDFLEIKIGNEVRGLDGIEVESIYQEEKEVFKSFLEENVELFPISLKSYIKRKQKERQNTLNIYKVLNDFQYEILKSNLSNNLTKYRFKNQWNKIKTIQNNNERIKTLTYFIKAIEEEIENQDIKDYFIDEFSLYVNNYIKKYTYKDQLNIKRQEDLKSIEAIIKDNNVIINKLTNNFISNDKLSIHYIYMIKRLKPKNQKEIEDTLLKKFFENNICFGNLMKLNDLSKEIQEKVKKEYEENYYKNFPILKGD